MKPTNLLKLALFALGALFLPAAATAQTVIEFDQTSIALWVESGEELTVPGGVSWRLELTGDKTVLLASDTTFKVVEDEEGKQRVILIRGNLVLDREDIGDEPLTIEAGGSIITSNGAGLVLSVDESGTSVAQLGDGGTVSVGGTPIAPGTGGSIGSDGVFNPSIAIQEQLSTTAANVRRGPPDDRPGPPDGRPDPQGKPPYDKLKPLPEEIVRENLNDISPS